MASFPNCLNFHRYGDSLVVSGGYAFLSWVSADYHFMVARVDLATGASDGVVDLGALPFNDLHFYASLAIDPTDNRLVWCRSGRSGSGVDNRTAIRKTANSYGGTAEQWAAGNFSAEVELPYPNVGIISYAHMSFTDNGTLLIVGSNRDSLANPGGNTANVGGYLYRYVGDGTSKTATQLAGGSWTHLLGAVDDAPDSTFSGVIYPGRTVYRNGRYAIAYHYFETLLEVSADNYAGTSPRKALAYVYTDNITDTIPTWRRVDGTALSVPIPSEAAQRSTVQFVHNDYGEYAASVDLLPDGTPFLGAPKWTLDGTAYQNHLYTGISGYTWNGSAWAEDVLYPNGLDKTLGASPTCRAFYNPTTEAAEVYSIRAIGGAASGYTVIDNLTDGTYRYIAEYPLQAVQIVAEGTSVVYAGVNGGSLIVGSVPAAYYLDVILEAIAATTTRRRQRIALGGV